MNSQNESFHAKAMSSVVAPNLSTRSEEVRSFAASFTAWVAESVPTIEKGIYRWDADPVELVRAFDPWLRDALKTMGPSPEALNPGEYQELYLVFGRAIDALERVYEKSGQSLAIGLSLLDGLEDLLIVLSLRSRVASYGPANRPGMRRSVPCLEKNSRSL